MRPSLSAIILTFNEEKHIERCIASVRAVATNIFVVDSYSTDNTVKLAVQAGVVVLQNPWTNYSTQFNWALDNIPLESEWCLRIDADEVLSQKLCSSIEQHVLSASVPHEVTGFYVPRLIKFNGKAMKWGGLYPVRHIRIFRRGAGRCEERWMDEHIVLAHGRTRTLAGDLIDDNLNNIGWWTAKHNSYATREAIDLLNTRRRFRDALRTDRLHLGTSEGRKRYVKDAIYSKLPIGLRPLLYFLYRYFLRLGFLDGQTGFVFHALQGFWYRLLVDVKVFEIEKRSAQTGQSLEDVVFAEYGIRLRSPAPA